MRRILIVIGGVMIAGGLAVAPSVAKQDKDDDQPVETSTTTTTDTTEPSKSKAPKDSSDSGDSSDSKGSKPAKESKPLEACPGHESDKRPQVVGTEDDDNLKVPEGGIGCGLGGNDVLRADRHGGTQLFGGEGDDLFCAKNKDQDRVYGGEGDDRAVTDDDDKVLDVEGDRVLIGCLR